MLFPDVLGGREFNAVVDATVAAAKAKKQVMLALGGAVFKTGCGVYLRELVEAGVVTSVALTGCGFIHDLEIALLDDTSELLAFDGTFPQNTFAPRLLNEVIGDGSKGLGQRVLQWLPPEKARFGEKSLLCACKEEGVVVTGHVGIGQDTTCMFSNYDGGAWGRASFLDFLTLSKLIEGLSEGVWFNIGSAVQLPEIFLKALNMAQRKSDVRNFTTVNMDFLKHYRPETRVIAAADRLEGKGRSLIGHHEVLIPLLVERVLEGLNGD